MHRNPARPLLAGDRGVSAVVGVVLLVGITVILVTVVAATALGFTDQLEDPGPQVSFEWEYDADDDTLQITHRGGDSFDAADVKIKWGGKTVDWATAGSGSTVSTGSSATIGDIDVDSDGLDSSDRVGPDEKVFVVNEPSPEAATLLGRWDGT